MTARDLLSEVQNDGPTAPCAACGMTSHHQGPGASRQKVEGKLIMLCTNAAACCSRYRQGLTPAVFAARLRTEKGLN